MSTRVAVELMPWVPRLIGRDEHKHAFLEYDCQAGETVRQLLTRMAGDYPRLGDMLLDRQKGELNFPIEVA
ncbi:MAG: hypothetical protein ACRDGF_10425, partial [Chloroflexota bacterium]